LVFHLEGLHEALSGKLRAASSAIRRHPSIVVATKDTGLSSDLRCHDVALLSVTEVIDPMSCAARQAKNVLCFECYRSRLDLPVRRTATVTLFPRVTGDFRIPDPRSPIPGQQLEHRRRMLDHLATTVAPNLPDPAEETSR
jgi:hypothetical protein